MDETIALLSLGVKADVETDRVTKQLNDQIKLINQQVSNVDLGLNTEEIGKQIKNINELFKKIKPSQLTRALENVVKLFGDGLSPSVKEFSAELSNVIDKATAIEHILKTDAGKNFNLLNPAQQDRALRNYMDMLDETAKKQEAFQKKQKEIKAFTEKNLGKNRQIGTIQQQLSEYEEYADKFGKIQKEVQESITKIKSSNVFKTNKDKNLEENIIKLQELYTTYRELETVDLSKIDKNQKIQFAIDKESVLKRLNEVKGKIESAGVKLSEETKIQFPAFDLTIAQRSINKATDSLISHFRKEMESANKALKDGFTNTMQEMATVAIQKGQKLIDENEAKLLDKAKKKGVGSGGYGTGDGEPIVDTEKQKKNLGEFAKYATATIEEVIKELDRLKNDEDALFEMEGMKEYIAYYERLLKLKSEGAKIPNLNEYKEYLPLTEGLMSGRSEPYDKETKALVDYYKKAKEAIFDEVKPPVIDNKENIDKINQETDAAKKLNEEKKELNSTSNEKPVVDGKDLEDATELVKVLTEIKELVTTISEKSFDIKGIETLDTSLEGVKEVLTEINRMNLNEFTSSIATLSEKIIGVNGLGKDFLTNETGEIITLYRGINDQIGANLNSNNYKHGATFLTDDLEVAKSYEEELSKIEKYQVALKNPLQIDADGKQYDKIKYLGNNLDEASQKINAADLNLQQFAETLRKIKGFENITDLTDPKQYSSVMKEMNKSVFQDQNKLFDKIQKNYEKFQEVAKDTSNLYGIHTTDWVAENAKDFGYDGVIFKNIQDGAKKLSNVVVTYSQEQRKYLGVVGDESKEVANEIESGAEKDTTSLDKVVSKLKEIKESLDLISKTDFSKSTTAITEMSEKLTNVFSALGKFDESGAFKFNEGMFNVQGLDTFQEGLNKILETLEKIHTEGTKPINETQVSNGQNKDLFPYYKIQDDEQIQKSQVALLNYRNTIKEINSLKLQPQTEESKRQLEELDQLALKYTKDIIEATHVGQLDSGAVSPEFNLKSKFATNKEDAEFISKLGSQIRQGVKFDNVDISSLTSIVDIIKKIESASTSLKQKLDPIFVESSKYVSSLRINLRNLGDANEELARQHNSQSMLEAAKKDIQEILAKYPELEKFKTIASDDKAYEFIKTDEWNKFLSTLPKAQEYLKSIGYEAEKVNEKPTEIKIEPKVNPEEFATQVSKELEGHSTQINVEPKVNGEEFAQKVTSEISAYAATIETKPKEDSEELTNTISKVKELLETYRNLHSQLKGFNFSENTEFARKLGEQSSFSSEGKYLKDFKKEIDRYKEMKRAFKDGTQIPTPSLISNFGKNLQYVNERDINEYQEHLVKIMYYLDQCGIKYQNFIDKTSMKDLSPIYNKYVDGMKEWEQESNRVDAENEQVNNSIKDTREELGKLLNLTADVNLNKALKMEGVLADFVEFNRDIDTVYEKLLKLSEIKTEQLKGHTATVETKPVTTTDESKISNGSGAMVEEEKQAESLKGKINEVTTAVDKKTDAFRQEEEVVVGTVQREVTELEVLDGQLQIIIESIKKIKETPLTIDNSSTKNLDDESAKALTDFKEAVNGIDLSKFGNVQTMIKELSIPKSVATNMQKLANAILNLRTNLNNLGDGGKEFLSSINTLLAKTEEFKDIIKNIDKIKKVTQNTTSTIDNGNVIQENVLETNSKTAQEVAEWAAKYKDELSGSLKIVEQIRNVQGETKISYKVTSENGNTKTFGANGDLLNSKGVIQDEIKENKILEQQYEEYEKLKSAMQEYYDLRIKVANGESKVDFTSKYNAFIDQKNKLEGSMYYTDSQKAEIAQLERGLQENLGDAIVSGNAKSKLDEIVDSYEKIYKLKIDIARASKNEEANSGLISDKQTLLEAEQQTYEKLMNEMSAYDGIISKENQLIKLKEIDLQYQGKLSDLERKNGVVVSSSADDDTAKAFRNYQAKYEKYMKYQAKDESVYGKMTPAESLNYKTLSDSMSEYEAKINSFIESNERLKVTLEDLKTAQASLDQSDANAIASSNEKIDATEAQIKANQELIDSYDKLKTEGVAFKERQKELIEETARQKFESSGELLKGFNAGNGEDQLKRAREGLATVAKEMGNVKRASNIKMTMNTDDVAKFSQEIRTADDNIVTMVGTLNKVSGEVRYSFTKSESAVKSFGEHIDDLKKKWGELFKYFTALYLDPYMMIGNIKELVSEISEFQGALTDISYTMDVTQKQLDDMGSAAIDKAKELAIPINDMMDILKVYSNMGETTDAMLEKATPTTILANLSGEDAATASDQLQAILKQFDLADDQAMHVVDVMDYVSSQIKQDFGTGLANISEGVETAGATVRAAGMDFETYASMVGNVSQITRQSGSEIGNAVKTSKIVSIYGNMYKKTYLKPVKPKALQLQCG